MSLESIVTATQEAGPEEGKLGLLVIASDAVARHELPPAGEVMLGRSKSVAIPVPDRLVSRQHAVVEIGPPLRIRDLGSANGTRVCGRRLAPGENELFGHERGAFTGALPAKPGLLEAARDGTVFLDEVAEMPLCVQAKLLGVARNRLVARMRAYGIRPPGK